MAERMPQVFGLVVKGEALAPWDIHASDRVTVIASNRISDEGPYFLEIAGRQIVRCVIRRKDWYILLHPDGRTEMLPPDAKVLGWVHSYGWYVPRHKTTAEDLATPEGYEILTDMVPIPVSGEVWA